MSATFWGSLQELSALYLNVAKSCKYLFPRANSGEKVATRGRADCRVEGVGYYWVGGEGDNRGSGFGVC